MMMNSSMSWHLFILLVDLVGFVLFWYVWREFEKRRNIDQILALLFTFFLIIDTAWVMFPDRVPVWMVSYVPSCWLVIFTRLFLASVVFLDIHRGYYYNNSGEKRNQRRKVDKIIEN